MYSRRELRREATLSEGDLAEVRKCRRPQNRLGFAYQLAFVRLVNRFPQQEPFEVLDDLVAFTAVQLELDAGLIDLYRRRRQTISEHQRAIIEHLGLRELGTAEVGLLEAFVFGESCRLENTAALQARAKEFLKEHRILEPAESRVLRLIGEQPKVASEHIFERVAADIPRALAMSCWWWRLMNQCPRSSGSRRIRAGPRPMPCSLSLRRWRRSRRVQTPDLAEWTHPGCRFGKRRRRQAASAPVEQVGRRWPGRRGLGRESEVGGGSWGWRVGPRASSDDDSLDTGPDASRSAADAGVDQLISSRSTQLQFSVRTWAGRR